MWPLYIGSNGQIRKSIPFSVKVAPSSGVPLGLVGQERNGRGRSAAVLCAGFEYKIRLD